MNKIELYSKEVEENILGCILVFEGSQKYIKQLTDKDFYIELNQTIFALIRTLYKNKKPIQLISIKELAKTFNLDEQKIFKHLIKLTSDIITSANIEYYIKKLKNYSIRREIERKARKIIDDVYKADSDIEAGEIKKNSIQELSEIQISTFNTNNNNMVDVIADTVLDIEKRYNRRDDNRYKTGFFDLDKITDGLHEQEFTIIAARPRSWKNIICFTVSGTYSEKRFMYIFY